LPPVVDGDVLELARTARHRVRDRTAQVRRRFIRRDQPEDEKPPLARMLVGGRGGEAKLKMYLTLLWLGAGSSHEVTIPPQKYARLLGFDDPYRKGARRVRDSIDWLEHNNFVSVQRRPGRDHVLTLLREDGLGAAYEVPGKAGKVHKDPINHYFKIGPGFWSSGWAAYLSAPATAMLLVLLDESRNARAYDLWISPSQLEERYGFSDDTRWRGVTELQKAGLVCVTRKSIDPDFDRRRVRNMYHIEPALLDLTIDAEAESRWRNTAERLSVTPRDAWTIYADGRLSHALTVAG
jgi:hypothetical protein